MNNTDKPFLTKDKIYRSDWTYTDGVVYIVDDSNAERHYAAFYFKSLREYNLNKLIEE